ncbi:MAG: HDIG domain-containing protein [Deltaproteobacteria bacterium]|nr:HDIG domain-containing protein [Deltaproteobacteria bacterium]
MTALFLFSLISGFILFRIILLLLPRLEGKESRKQRDEVLKEAKRQARAITEDTDSQLKERMIASSEELDAFLLQKRNDLASEETDLQEQEKLRQNDVARVERRERELVRWEQSVEVARNEALQKKKESEKLAPAIMDALAQHTRVNLKALRSSLHADLINAKQLEAQKVLKSLQEEVSSSAAKLAHRVLDRVHARYAPIFVWPKSSNIIDVRTKFHSLFLAEDSKLIEEIQELSGTKVIPFQANDQSLSLKVAGGFGIYREAMRLTLEKIFSLEEAPGNKLSLTFDQCKKKLESEAVQLGKTAVTILRLENVHPELQKLVGALNWRTSYRQNQWYHTLEVAQLASILAFELDVSPSDAKRVGLLHDIGKAIDYNIEGSHAVISGDYADRFGEKRYICDTVMSHHADLVLETPLAFVLQAADTLSGARPGARVNLEEGYQVRLTAIHDVIRNFTGVLDLAVMNGGREVHIQMDHTKVRESDVEAITKQIARQIERDVAFPGQIKILVTRTYESTAVA